MRALCRCAVLVAGLGLGAGDLAGQSLWVTQAPSPILDVTFARPMVANSNLGTLSGSARIAATFPLGSATLVHLELPLIRASNGGEEFIEGARETAIAAPYVGIIGSNASGNLWYQAGVRLAVWGSDNLETAAIGALSDMERFEAYVSKLATFRSSVQFGRMRGPGLGLQGRIGAAVMIPTESGEEPEALVDYGARVGNESERGFLFADLSGRMWATESGVSLADRTTHQVGVSGGWVVGRITPTLEVRLPLDESEPDLVVRIGARLRW